MVRDQAFDRQVVTVVFFATEDDMLLQIGDAHVFHTSLGAAQDGMSVHIL